jgi:crotonobetainyl-CoA:carnitine CoA-transferase CaiB-like acyl-CoA transferase
MAARGIVSEIPHPAVGSVPNVRLPFRLAGTPLADPVAAPGLGQHSAAILREVLGCDDATIETLAASGAVGLGKS